VELRSEAGSAGRRLINRRPLVPWPSQPARPRCAGRGDGRVHPPLPKRRTEAQTASVLRSSTPSRLTHFEPNSPGIMVSRSNSRHMCSQLVGPRFQSWRRPLPNNSPAAGLCACRLVRLFHRQLVGKGFSATATTTASRGYALQPGPGFSDSQSGLGLLKMGDTFSKTLPSDA
jgi:hypothetical protein